MLRCNVSRWVIWVWQPDPRFTACHHGDYKQTRGGRQDYLAHSGTVTGVDRDGYRATIWRSYSLQRRESTNADEHLCIRGIEV